MEATLTIKLKFESWFDNDRIPKNNDEWKEFFYEHFIPQSSILGFSGDEYDDMIDISEYELECDVK